MNTTTLEKKNKSLPMKILTYLGYAIGALIVLAILAKFIWKMTGDGQWKLEKDLDGIKVYSKKDSGSSLLKFKTIRTIDRPMAQLVALIKDTTLDNCKRWFDDCINMETVKEWDPKTMSHMHIWTMGFGEPFEPRDLVVEQKFSVNPENQSILVEITAFPDAVPERDCCVRVPRMRNTWRYTPLANGEIEVEFVQDSDFGGMLPDILMNMNGVEMNYGFLKGGWPRLLDYEGYKDANLDFLKD